MRLIINLCLLFTTSITADFRGGGVEGAGCGEEGERGGERDAPVLSPLSLAGLAPQEAAPYLLRSSL